MVDIMRKVSEKHNAAAYGRIYDSILSLTQYLSDSRHSTEFKPCELRRRLQRTIDVIERNANRAKP